MLGLARKGSGGSNLYKFIILLCFKGSDNCCWQAKEMVAVTCTSSSFLLCFKGSDNCWLLGIEAYIQSYRPERLFQWQRISCVIFFSFAGKTWATPTQINLLKGSHPWILSFQIRLVLPLRFGGYIVSQIVMSDGCMVHFWLSKAFTHWIGYEYPAYGHQLDALEQTDRNQREKVKTFPSTSVHSTSSEILILIGGVLKEIF